MNPEAVRWRRQLPRAITASLVGLGTCLALVGAAPQIDNTPLQPTVERPELDGRQVVAYEDHPAAGMMDTDTRKVLATRHVAGFGGAYVDEEADVLHVWLTRPTQELGHQAHEALHQGAGFDTLTSRKIVVHQARFTFAQLKAWKDKARELFALPEVVMLDVSERINRIWVGVHGNGDLSPLAVERLANLGIPADAVVSANVPQLPKLALRDNRRPLAGGTQIQFQTGTGGFGTGTCTLGFPAIRDGQLGFVTNAHCSRTRGAVDDGRYWQATRPALDTNQVGTEIVDPPFFVGGPCPADKICSFTDAIFVRAHGGVGVDRGRLAAVPCCGSLDWNGINTWRVTDNFFTFTGNAVRKVGRTSGTTLGTVVAECVETNVNGTDIRMFCQDVVDMMSDFGDSGSPVFEVTHSPAINDVRAVGVLWGLAEEADGNILTFITPTPFVHDVITGPGLCASGFGC